MDILNAQLQVHSPEWCNPPWNLIPKLLRRVADFECQVLMIVPLREMAPWWLLWSKLVQRQMVLRQPTYRFPDRQTRKYTVPIVCGVF